MAPPPPLSPPNTTTPFLRGAALPAAVEEELQRICVGRLLPYPDPAAREKLAYLGEAAAVRVLRQIGESRTVHNFSAFIVHMATKGSGDAMARNARGISTAESAAFLSGPASASRRDESVDSPLYHDATLMEVDSPFRTAHRGLLVRESTPSPVREITRHVSEMAGPMAKIAAVTPARSEREMVVPVPARNGHYANPLGEMVSPRMTGPMAETVAGVPARHEREMMVPVPVRNGHYSNPLREMPSPRMAGPMAGITAVALARPEREMMVPVPVRNDHYSNPSREMASPWMTGPMAGITAVAPARPNRDMMSVPVRNGHYSNPLRDLASPQMLALGHLEFRKAFLILNYLGKQKLEDVLSVEDIRSFQNMGMPHFEMEIWSKAGCRGISGPDRRKNLSWDESLTHVYHCNVDLYGNTSFKGPYLESTRTHLQRTIGDENTLVVKFEEKRGESRSAFDFDNYCDCYHRIAENGIVLGLRLYRFFVFKDGGKEEKKKCPTSSPVRCYFVRTESGWAIDEGPYILSDKTIAQARAMFMHVHTSSKLAKYMARLALILSKTIKLDVDLSTVDVRRVEDIPCKDENGNIVLNEDGEPMIHTDGTGLISEDLAMKCPTNVFKGSCLKSHDLQNIVDGVEALTRYSSSKKPRSLAAEPPLLMQVRTFYHGLAIKGTLLVDKTLPQRTICVRPSMIKIEADPELSDVQSFNSLELVTTSNRPKKATLSRFLIALLHYGEVPAEYFMELLTNTLEDAMNARYSTRHALKVALNHADMDDSIAARMILCGIPLNEPYLLSRLSVMMEAERKGIKIGKLPVDDCYYLMGTVDPTGTLKANEVCVILENGQLSGDVLVYKSPGLHFGDIHILKASYVKGLEKIVGNSKYAIFFPTTGRRSLADEMANSDFDGDMYWVSRNPQFLKYFKASEPWVRSPKPIKRQQEKEWKDDLERSLFHQFLNTRFKPSYAMSTAADSWLVFMDRLLTVDVNEKETLKAKMLELVDIYYDALDAPKKGEKVDVPGRLRAEKHPHFMERENGDYYHSASILGMIYDKATSFQMENTPPSEIWKVPCFAEAVPPSCIDKWGGLYKTYLEEMTDLCSVSSSKECIEELFQKYKQMLYEAPDFEQSIRSHADIFNEAQAIYQLAYDKAIEKNSVQRCGFAWKVAGRALCQLCAIKQGDSSIICSRALLREVVR